MNTIRKICLIAFCFVFASAAFSQQPGKVTLKLNYNIALPLGNFKSDYISNTSFRGGSGEISYWLNTKFALGLSAGYQSYYQKYGRGIYKLDGNQTVSAVLSNTIETTPVTINATFVPMAGTGRVQPYASLGAGASFVNYRQYLGEFSNGSTNAAFTAKAEGGVMIGLGKTDRGAKFQLGANYNLTPYNKNGLSNLNHAGVTAGLIFPVK